MRLALVVLEALAPAERLALCCTTCSPCPSRRSPPSWVVLRPQPGNSPAARRRIQGAGSTPDADLTRKREVVEAFLAASRSGNSDALLALLDPDVVLRADGAAVRMGASSEVLGAPAVATTVLGSGRAQGAQLALVDGTPGAVWAQGGQPRVVFSFTITDGKIVAIDLLADPELLGQLDWEALGG